MSVNARCSRGASPIAIVAALSVAMLIAALGSTLGERMRPRPEPEPREPAQAREYVPVSDADGDGIPDWQEELFGNTASTSETFATTTASTDPVANFSGAVMQSLVSGYLSLKEYDQYTPERGELLAERLAAQVKAPTIFLPHTESELTLVADTGESQLLRYRADMRVALAPMVDLTAEPEFSLYARYVATNDAAWLDKLAETATRYRTAEKAALEVTVPMSAKDVHLRAINALGKYTETLERLVRFANDPIASLALLRTYNEDEREFLLAFDALAKFYVANVGQ